VPFLISLMVNDLWLHNCMLDSGAPTNVMTLQVMNQLGLKITRPYRNVCEIDSRVIKVCGLIKDLEVRLVDYPEVPFVMDVVVIDVLDAWGILLSKDWVATLGGSLQMDLSYATIPIGNEAHAILFNQPKKTTHVEDPESDSEFDTSSQEDQSKETIDPPLDFDPDDLPFAQEEDFTNIIWPKREDYQRQLNKYKDKDLGPITILKRESETKLHEYDQRNIAIIRSHSPTLEQGRDAQEGKEVIDSKEEDFQLGKLVLMWDKSKGKPNLHKDFDCLWQAFQGPREVRQ
jgi:hypothetical protein